jgi:16S rRNA processing protein RimM
MGKEYAPPEFLIVGRILAPFGTRGEVKVQVETDFPDRFAPGKAVYLDGRPLQIESGRPHRQHLLLKLACVDCVEDAEKLRGRLLTIPRSELHPLDPDQYYAFQVIGLDVLTTEGEALGEIVDIMVTGSNDVYVARGKRGEILIPAIDDVVKSVDLENRRIVIEAIEGLLPSG